MNLLTFEPKEIQVCLVPVNGATPPNLQTLEKELNKIFKPAVASVKVSANSGINIAYAIGFGFALVLFAGLRKQIEFSETPKAMKGMPIALVTAGILAMAFMGFSGLVK